jgi:FixJ family two-component response regulator
MSSSARVEGKEVCLVDDDLAVLTKMQFLLRSDGLKVKPFNEPEDFLDYVASHTVSLAVLNVWMGRVTGLEILARLCALSPQTRVILISAQEDLAARATAMAIGPVAYFVRPFDYETFLDAVRKALGTESR